MCYGCYKELGSPAIVNDKVKLASGLASDVYKFNCVGGNCHIVLDDWNIEDHHIEWCLTDALSENIHKASKEELDIERRCLEAFKVLTIDERASALAIMDGWLIIDSENNHEKV